MGREKNKDARGEERREKETLARKPHDSAERPLHAFTLEHTSVACLSRRWPMRRKDMSTEVKYKCLAQF